MDLRWMLTGTVALAGIGLGVRRVRSDRWAGAVAQALYAVAESLPTFSEDVLDGLPEPARRYLRHAIAPGTPLAPAVRLWMTGAMTPTPGGAPVELTATETLAPRQGFVWTARAQMKGLPVRVRDHYYRGEGGVHVDALGLLPLPLGAGHAEDVARSARGRLIGEGVWCPTALVHPAVLWERVDDDRARYTITVDGEPIAVTLHVGADGALREVTLARWGDAGGKPSRLLPYGFRVEAEGTFGGVTIPTRISGGWHYGTDRFDLREAATFTLQRAVFARPAAGRAG